MGYRPLSWVVALDGGTTNTRVRLLHDSQVVATARRGVGVRDAVLGQGSGGERALEVAIRDAIGEVLRSAGGVRPDVIMAAGMLTSEAGLVTVPHVLAPAGVEDLAARAVSVDLPEVYSAPILFVPGVRTPAGAGPDGWGEADVMRGEECETFGALELTATSLPAAFVWPGSHTKLVRVDAAGKIHASTTTLAGELTVAVARHTLLAASLPAALPDEPDADAVAAGARRVAREGIGRCAFLVRMAALSGALDPARRAAFWIGAVVADDADHFTRHPLMASGIPVWVGGSEPFRHLYTDALSTRHPGPVRSLSNEDADRVSALGALAVARRVRNRRG